MDVDCGLPKGGSCHRDHFFDIHAVAKGEAFLWAVPHLVVARKASQGFLKPL